MSELLHEGRDGLQTGTEMQALPRSSLQVSVSGGGAPCAVYLL